VQPTADRYLSHDGRRSHADVAAHLRSPEAEAARRPRPRLQETRFHEPAAVSASPMAPAAASARCVRSTEAATIIAPGPATEVRSPVLDPRSGGRGANETRHGVVRLARVDRQPGEVVEVGAEGMQSPGRLIGRLGGDAEPVERDRESSHPDVRQPAERQ